MSNAKKPGQRLGVSAGLPVNPVDILRRSERAMEGLQIRNARQKALLNRASVLMKRAVDECHCGGVERAILSLGYTTPLVDKEDGDDGEAQVGAPDELAG